MSKRSRALPDSLILQKAAAVTCKKSTLPSGCVAEYQNASPRSQAAGILLDYPWHRLTEFAAWHGAVFLCWPIESPSYKATVLLTGPLFSQSSSVQCLAEEVKFTQRHQSCISKGSLSIILFVYLFVLFGGYNRTPGIWWQVSLDFVSTAPQNMHGFTQIFLWHSQLLWVPPKWLSTIFLGY